MQFLISLVNVDHRSNFGTLSPHSLHLPYHDLLTQVGTAGFAVVVGEFGAVWVGCFGGPCPELGVVVFGSLQPNQPGE
jgi:hypothetical protein